MWVTNNFVLKWSNMSSFLYITATGENKWMSVNDVLHFLLAEAKWEQI